jgi:hypothetical protein
VREVSHEFSPADRPAVRKAKAWQQFMVPCHQAGFDDENQSDVHLICFSQRNAIIEQFQTPGTLQEMLCTILQLFCVHFWPGIWNAGESVITYEI